jgi:hypothetical protein
MTTPGYCALARWGRPAAPPAPAPEPGEEQP